MEVQGKIIFAFDVVTGMAKATGNPWKKRDYVLETHDQFPRKIAFDMFGDKVDQYPLAVGDEIVLSFDIESREYNGRWYTNIRGWKAEKVVPGQPQGGYPQGGYQAPAAPPAYGAGDPFGNNMGAAQPMQPAAAPAPVAAPASNPDDLPF